MQIQIQALILFSIRHFLLFVCLSLCRVFEKSILFRRRRRCILLSQATPSRKTLKLNNNNNRKPLKRFDSTPIGAAKAYRVQLDYQLVLPCQCLLLASAGKLVLANTSYRPIVTNWLANILLVHQRERRFDDNADDDKWRTLRIRQLVDRVEDMQTKYNFCCSQQTRNSELVTRNSELRTENSEMLLLTTRE